MKPPETVKRLIKEASFNASEEMDKTLRASIARANSDGAGTPTQERKRTRRHIMRSSIARITLAAIVCGAAVAAAVGGMRLYRYHFEGRGDDGTYVFTTEPEVIEQDTAKDPNGNVVHTATTRAVRVGIRSGHGEEVNIEQTQADLEEIDQLRQRGDRRLVRTIDGETENGPMRINLYEYTLSDGRTITMGENEPQQQ